MTEADNLTLLILACVLSIKSGLLLFSKGLGAGFLSAGGLEVLGPGLPVFLINIITDIK